MPQKAVAQAGKHKGHAGLRVAVRQFERAALDVQVRLLVLAHAEQFFVRVGFKAGGELVIAAQDGVELARVDLQGADKCLEVFWLLFGALVAVLLPSNSSICFAAVAVEFFQQHFAILVEEDDFAGCRSDGR